VIARSADEPTAATTAQDPAALLALIELLTERNRQLEQALQSRIAIEQAKGVLAERLGLAPDEAFEVLRRAARTQRRRIQLLAAEIVAVRVTPAAVNEAAVILAANGGLRARA
jgi:hypothetical protein